MIVNAVYKIGSEFVVGDDKCIYKLPHTLGTKKYKIKKLKEFRGGYFFKQVFVLKENINYEVITPYVLIDENKLPF